MDNEIVDIRKLKEALDSICTEEVHLKGIEQIPLDALIRLKTVVANVNNHITKKLSEKFVYALFELQLITEEELKRVQIDLLSSNVSTNGYDIIIEGNKKILAEIKANIPYGINQYGSKQKEEIEKDLNGLKTCKPTSKGIQLGEYIKFFVQLDAEGTKNGIRYDSKKAMKRLTSKRDDIVYDFNRSTTFRNDTIYVMLIKA